MAEFVDGRINGDYGEQLLALAQKVEDETIQRLKEQDLGCEANLLNARTWIRIGQKYDKIDIGTSGRFMVERATGEVFGIKAYGKIHKGHKYGTLDTIDEWFWGNYYPIPLAQHEKRIRIRLTAKG